MAAGVRAAARTVGLLLGIVLTSCTETYYEWGAYEDHLYELLVEADTDPADAIARLVDQMEQTEHKGKRIPPGMRAHVGFLYSRVGNDQEAVRWLTAEKLAFPESAVFVDGLLTRAKTPRGKS